MLNKKKALDMEKGKKKPSSSSSTEKSDDLSAEPSSEDFWLSLQANSKIQVRSHRLQEKLLGFLSMSNP
jgi:hypothetical protein